MDSVVLFDLDNTLIDVFLLIDGISRSMQLSTGLSPVLFQQIKNKYTATLEKSTDFNPEDFLQLLSKESSKELSILREIFFEDKTNFENAVFPDVLSLLNKLNKMNKLGIYSEGVLEYQKIKLRNSALQKYFQEDLIFIARRKLEPSVLERLPNGSTVVDDNPDVIKILPKDKVTPIWLNRKDEGVIDGIKTIYTLENF